MTRDPKVTADALTDVAYFVPDGDGDWATVFDGEVVYAELVDEPPPEGVAAAKVRKLVEATVDEPDGPPFDIHVGPVTAPSLRPNLTGFVPKVPELNPRRRHPDEPTPIFDELDARRGRKSWTKTMQRYRTALTRKQEQYQLEEGAHRDRVWEIEHASEVLNRLGQR